MSVLSRAARLKNINLRNEVKKWEQAPLVKQLYEEEEIYKNIQRETERLRIALQNIDTYFLITLAVKNPNIELSHPFVQQEGTDINGYDDFATYLKKNLELEESEHERREELESEVEKYVRKWADNEIFINRPKMFPVITLVDIYQNKTSKRLRKIYLNIPEKEKKDFRKKLKSNALKSVNKRIESLNELIVNLDAFKKNKKDFMDQRQYWRNVLNRLQGTLSTTVPPNLSQRMQKLVKLLLDWLTIRVGRPGEEISGIRF